MASWNDLSGEYQALAPQARTGFLNDRLHTALCEISKRRGNTNVLLYGSGFLQKPAVAPTLTQIMPEDINGFMSTMYGMKWDAGLTLILHTPGGVTTAAQTIVSYLMSKFEKIEVIVPTFAMSAGTMIALASQNIVMGRQSQLGPIDPQMPVNGKYVSAQSILEQFGSARTEILANPLAAHVWAPILQTIGPALLHEAKNSIEYGKTMVKQWLEQRMYVGNADTKAKAAAAAEHFGTASNHKDHGRRIDRDEASQYLVTERLEDDQELQEQVLTAYHLMTIVFEQSLATKIMTTSHKRTWLKNANVV
ncbi:SppA protein [Burkholderia pseudomallei]|uniref:SDH family Clp fold serine proteinase n=1 Tax=Burkholderia thailandensis TaxID=57975 RepID=UPI0013791071|nr:serine protease [Burkholderia thailandensis]NBD04857.1 serine protease [Burkholderia thailandensis]CAJ3418862.1 SppA protein [Burkholderia pseudomallei]CAJ9746675.1 SppA protein [Burkholderia pseudomallei]